MGAEQGDLLKAVGQVARLRLPLEVQEPCGGHVGRLLSQHRCQAERASSWKHHLYQRPRSSFAAGCASHLSLFQLGLLC